MFEASRTLTRAGLPNFGGNVLVADTAGRLIARLLQGKNEVASFPEYAVQRDE